MRRASICIAGTVAVLVFAATLSAACGAASVAGRPRLYKAKATAECLMKRPEYTPTVVPASSRPLQIAVYPPRRQHDRSWLLVVGFFPSTVAHTSRAEAYFFQSVSAAHARYQRYRDYIKGVVNPAKIVQQYNNVFIRWSGDEPPEFLRVVRNCLMS